MASSHEDQLVAAVNDKMDPITLLVWCEQCLSPKELPTLNRLLRSDDGTLAQEIGWNLLEMVLAMLEEDAREAVECLDCIARRGNPREVIVKVAEVLEKLGEDTGVSEDDEESVDELPTFAGEADRIHLGTLTLDGMPVATDLKPYKSAEVDQKSDEAQTEGRHESLVTLQFQSLMSMLGILHLRIKTQYPSRFLATSLPAALGAYRQIGVTAFSTFAFLSFLGKLSGQKPRLPARTPSAPVKIALPQVPGVCSQSTSIPTVLMPDSEPEFEGSSMQQAAQHEKDIVLRLLQAVLLEALDDYMASLQSRDPSHMSWTTRLREKAEPRRLIPGKATELQKWRTSKPLSERDRVLEEFLTISKDLRFDVNEHFRNLLDENGRLFTPTPEMEDAQPPSDYPTRPSQVPFPPSGMLFLYAAQQFSSYPPAVSTSEPDNPLALTSRVYHFFRSEANTAYLHASFATEDALLSLLYMVKDKSQPANAAFDFKSIFMSLATFCAEFPDPQLRDAAHNIATALFHNCSDIKTKLNLVTEILKHETTPVKLKAVAVGWVKDEIATPADKDARSTEQAKIRDADLDLDPVILPLLFPVYTSASASRPELEHYDLSKLSYYIASLNLVYVLAGEHTAAQTSSAMKAVITGLNEWRSLHRDVEDKPAEDEMSSKIRAALNECRMDLCALDDALERSSKAMKHPTAAYKNRPRDTEVP